MDYKNIKKKIYKINIQSNNNVNKFDKINNIDSKNFKLYFKKNIRDYSTEWSYIGLINNIIIKLNNFPEDYIAFMRVVPIFKTNDGFLNNSNYKEWSPVKYYNIFEKDNNNYQLKIRIEKNYTTFPIYFKAKIYLLNCKEKYEIQTKKT